MSHGGRECGDRRDFKLGVFSPRPSLSMPTPTLSILGGWRWLPRGGLPSGPQPHQQEVALPEQVVEERVLFQGEEDHLCHG